MRNSSFAPGLDHFLGVVRRSGLFQRFEIVSSRWKFFAADEVLSILDVCVGKMHIFCGDLRCVGEDHW